MSRSRSWTDQQLQNAVSNSYSYRAVLQCLRLVPAGGNYVQIQNRIKELNLDTTHFTGSGWNKGMKYSLLTRRSLKELLAVGSKVQSYKLKKRLFDVGLLSEMCQLCGWCKQAPDGRIPVELDHINGDRNDNRIENLRILCPNCHSLQSTHRGKNKKVALRLQ